MAPDASYVPFASSYHGGLGDITCQNVRGVKTILNAHKNKRNSSSYRRLRVQTNPNVSPKWMMHNPNVTSHPSFDHFGLGSKIDDGFLFHQTLAIRAYEIGADGKASMETILNYLQETNYNIGKEVGVLGDGFDLPQEMCNNLIWVVTRMQVQVDRFPTWGDVTQIEATVTISGKHGYRCDWLICDRKKREVFVRASSNMALMNKSTRRLSKMPDQIRAKLDQFVVDRPPIIVKDTRILPKLDETIADHVCSGLMPRWSDLDVNEHVNHVKYTGWILESVPKSILRNYVLSSMTLEYHQECGKDSMLQSLITVTRNDNDGCSNHVDCHHMLRLEDGGGMIMKGWTRWCQKYQKS